MKIFLAIIGLVVLYIILELGIFWYRVDHLPNLPTPDQSEKTFGQGPVLRYIAVGDSTAAGIGASSLQNTYTYKVAEYLAKSHTVTYGNIGVKGYKTSDVLTNQIRQIVAFKPDVVTISMGANDATHLVSEKVILQNYKNIIAQIQNNTSATIYITDIPSFTGSRLLPWFYTLILEARFKTLNPQILALESNRVKIINIHDFGWAQYPDLQTTYAADNFHPNDLGYQNWTNAFLSKITQ